MTDQSAQLEINVTNARREFEEGGKVKNLPFWVFFITCRTTLQKYLDTVKRPAGTDVATLTVWRRYNDFLWLRSALTRTYGGHIVPPVPAKDMAGTMDKIADLVAGDEESEDWRANEFISFRLRALDMFVRYLGKSSVAGTDLVRNFLCMTGHEEWSTFKQNVEAQLVKNQPSWSETLSSVGVGMWSKLRNVVAGTSSTDDTKKLPVGSPLARIQAQCRAFETIMVQLQNLSVRCLTSERYMSGGPPVMFEWQVKHDPKQPIPLWMLSLGHRVSSVDGHLGVVRYVGADDPPNGVLIGVEWSSPVGDCDGVGPDFQRYFQTKEKHASYVSQRFLYFPSNGVSDPVLLAAKETASQVDSYLIPCGSVMLQRLSRLVDLTAFWRMYAAGIVEAIEMFESLEVDRKKVMEQISKEVKPDLQQGLRTKLEELVKVAREREEIFLQQYKGSFLIDHRESSREILELFVITQRDLSTNGSVWDTKMKPVMRLLQSGS